MRIFLLSRVDPDPCVALDSFIPEVSVTQQVALDPSALIIIMDEIYKSGEVVESEIVEGKTNQAGVILRPQPSNDPNEPLVRLRPCLTFLDANHEVSSELAEMGEVYHLWHCPLGNSPLLHELVTVRPVMKEFRVGSDLAAYLSKYLLSLCTCDFNSSLTA